MMNEFGGAMWGMGLFWILVLILLALGIAALAKYLFFQRRDPLRESIEHKEEKT